ncbi:MAG: DUF3990 domain-containing protein [Prevotella ruminicola]|jgi:hypothetical protein|uniref:DUF3990 domain-containing protein n=1 Tax=Xylanibacter ruminicola TaxID=839 RepID=A0A9D5S6R5_XYLRU|nr:DUF3990 domain-containing protein [Xylanibacter ruminicola]
MKLFHASTLRIDKPDVLHSREKLDFGRGFYLTNLYEQAVRYSERFTRRGKEAFINEYEMDEETPGFIIKTFESYDEEWLDYVALCRKGDITAPKYDAVSGGVANDNVFNTIDLYFAGLITKEEALGRLKYEKPNHQLCILNGDMLCRHLHFIKAERVK